MIRSMTGFGQGTAEGPGVRVTAQARSVNNRFADVRLRLPAELAPAEATVRRAVLDRVRRGRVEMEVTVDRSEGAAAPVLVNRPLAEGIVRAARALRDELRLHGEIDLATLVGMPGVLRPPAAPASLDGAGMAAVLEAVRAAVEALDAERLREGESLRADLLERLARMESLASGIRTRAGEVPAVVQRRLLARLSELSTEVALDPARVAQEVAFLADRCDVTEELVRLDGHLAQARALLSEPDGEPVGKRLDFLLQEIHRETNTINAKASDLDISRKALDLKTESEKVREQIMNLE